MRSKLSSQCQNSLALETLEDRAMLNGSDILATARSGFVSDHSVLVVTTPTEHQLVGDYNGDGRDDVAQFSDGNWNVTQSLVGGKQCRTVDIKTGGVAALPGVCVDTTIAPPHDRTPIVLQEGDDLQAAIDNAQPGDILELEAGATFRGRFEFSQKNGDDWIHVRSSRHAELPPTGVRIDPERHAKLMPKIIASGPGANGRAIDILAGAHHIHFQGIEITSDYDRNDGVASNLVVLNAFGLEDASQLPHHIIFDHVYVHGNDQGSVLNGVRMDGRHVAVVDSYFDQFRALGRESHAVYAADGAGPIKIANNHLEAAGVTVLFGGDDPEIHGLVNSDIEIRDNLIRKSEATRTGEAVHKFLLEFKNAQRILATGNTLENAWADGRFGDGTALLIKSTNQEGACTWCVASDVTFAHNIIRQASIGVKIAGRVSGISERTERVVIENNLIYNADTSREVLGKTIPFVMLEDYDDVHIVNNTVATEGKALMQLSANLPGLRGLNLVVRDNVLSHNTYGVKGGGSGTGKASLDAWVDQYTFENNVIVGRSENDSSVYPDSTLFASSIAFHNPSAGDFGLATTSTYKGRGTDGSDIGAETSALDRATCAQSGQCALVSKETWGQWAANVPWRDVHTADVNGDGRDDVVGRANGEWWVAKSTTHGFVNEHWTSWPGSEAWEDVQIADMNGDGRDDIVGRAAGKWWLAKSTGESFANEYLDSWSQDAEWHDVLIADTDGNGQDEILGRANGQWWGTQISPAGVTTEPFAAWSNTVDWLDVRSTDLNGDGRTDIIGRANGQWWVTSREEQGGIQIRAWGRWSDDAPWQHVQTVDINGDGKNDMIGQSIGAWWAAISNGSTFLTTSLGTWLSNGGHQDVRTADINGDGKGDLVQMDRDAFSAVISSGVSIFE